LLQGQRAWTLTAKSRAQGTAPGNADAFGHGTGLDQTADQHHWLQTLCLGLELDCCPEIGRQQLLKPSQWCGCKIHPHLFVDSIVQPILDGLSHERDALYRRCLPSMTQIGMQQIHHAAHLDGEFIIKIEHLCQVVENVAFIVQQRAV